MPDHQSRLDELMSNYTNNTLSESGLEELCAIVKASNDAELASVFENGLRNAAFKEMNPQKLARMLKVILEKVNTNINEEDSDRKAPVIRLWKRIAVAASIIGILFVAGYLIVSRQSSVVDPTHDSPLTTHDIKAPDKNRAQIKLSDGRIIYLDSAGKGDLVEVNGVKVIKTEDGRIQYNGQSSVVSGPLTFNTMTNPRGSQVIAMTLEDGSRVWLNAGSSVTYPVVFTGRERKVEITGEAYFEVAHNAAKPFIVSKGEMNVTVLGTHFNVNAYDDESEMKVTLLEGSVQVANRQSSVVIKPNQQAVVASDYSPLTIHHSPDLEQVMAWKNGSFVFGERMSAEEIMRQIARWYDVEVVYEKKPSGHIGGSISRDVNITKVLQILEATGTMKFKVEGRKVTLY